LFAYPVSLSKYHYVRYSASGWRHPELSGNSFDSLVQHAWAGSVAVEVRLQSDAIVDGIPQSLFATQIPFPCLYADVPQQELYLLEFSSCLVTKSRMFAEDRLVQHLATCTARMRA
jgi:hypothetical protein